MDNLVGWMVVLALGKNNGWTFRWQDGWIPDGELAQSQSGSKDKCLWAQGTILGMLSCTCKKCSLQQRPGA